MALRLAVYKSFRWVYRHTPSTLKRSCFRVQRGLRDFYYRVDNIVFSNRASLYCPCCDYHLRAFKSRSYTMRTDYFNPQRYKGIEQKIICPVCGSLPRHRILATWMNDHKQELKGEILYFAREESMDRWLKRNGIKTISADIKGHPDLIIDMQDTGLQENSWDWIICNHVLEHVDDYQKALKELYKILKQKGHLIISFPIDETLDTVKEDRKADTKNRIEQFGQIDHWRLFGRDSEDIIKNIGFEVSRISGEGLPMCICPNVGPADYDVNYLFLCKKP